MDLYTFDHVKLTPDKQITLHSQESWELSHVVTGSGEREIGDTTEPFAPGDLVLIPPGIPHCWHFDPRCTDGKGRIENITVAMEDIFLDKVGNAFPALAQTTNSIKAYTDAVTFDKPQAARIISILKRMCNETEPERAASMLALLCALAREGRAIGYYHKPDINRQRLMQVRIYVSCNYHCPISLDEIANHVGMNRSAFCTFFRKHTGQTFVDYLNAYRVNIAHRLLAWEGLPVTEACFACGFNDVAYFCRTFKRYKGFPPSRAKKS